MKSGSDSFKKLKSVNLQPDLSKRRERTQVNKIINERGEITANITEIQLQESIFKNHMPNQTILKKWINSQKYMNYQN